MGVAQRADTVGDIACKGIGLRSLYFYGAGLAMSNFACYKEVMFVIQKITQCYDPEQDRIGLTAQNAEGQVLLLWLTQRLANRLAGVLANWLDEDVKTMASGESIFSLHTWEQSAAQAQFKPERPVERVAAQGEALMNAVDLARGPNGYTLTFKWGSEGAARLILTATELRQWLIILHRQFDTAGWPKHAWPEWFAAGAQSCALSAEHHVLH